MRLLHLIPTMEQGGSERHLLTLMQALKQISDMEIEQHVAIIHPTWLYPFFYRDKLEELDIPFTLLNKPPGKIGRLALAFRYGRLLRRYKPDIVYAVLWDSVDFIRVYHHLLPGPRLIGSRRVKITSEERFERERRLVGRVDKMVTVSRALERQFRANVPGSENELLTIENSINLEAFYPGNRMEARSRVLPELPAESLLILFPARIAEQKNHRVLLEAIKRGVERAIWSENARVLCAGFVAEQELYEELQRFIQCYQLGKYVQFHPPITDIVPYYHACDVLVLPSLYEGMPNIVLEAMACERPALLSESANESEVIEDGKSGWVVPDDDADALLQQLIGIFNLSCTERDAIGKKARASLFPRFTVERMVNQHLKLYRELLAKPKKREI